MSSDSSPSTPEKPTVFLEGDDEIRGQKYVCLSFLTPNRGILRNKDLFFFSKFLEFYNMDYKIRSTESFLAAQFRELQNILSEFLVNSHSPPPLSPSLADADSRAGWLCVPYSS